MKQAFTSGQKKFARLLRGAALGGIVAITGCATFDSLDSEDPSAGSALMAGEKEVRLPAELRKFEFNESRSKVVSYWRLSQIESPTYGRVLVFTGYKSTSKKSISQQRPDITKDDAVYEVIVPTRAGEDPVFRSADPSGEPVEETAKLAQDFRAMAARLDPAQTHRFGDNTKDEKAAETGSPASEQSEATAARDDDGEQRPAPASEPEAETEQASAADPAGDEATLPDSEENGQGQQAAEEETTEAKASEEATSEENTSKENEQKDENEKDKPRDTSKKVSCALGAVANVAGLIGQGLGLAKDVAANCSKTAMNGWFNLATGKCVIDTGREAMLIRNRQRAREVVSDTNSAQTCQGLTGALARLGNK